MISRRGSAVRPAHGRPTGRRLAALRAASCSGRLRPALLSARPGRRSRSRSRHHRLAAVGLVLHDPGVGEQLLGPVLAVGCRGQRARSPTSERVLERGVDGREGDRVRSKRRVLVYRTARSSLGSRSPARPLRPRWPDTPFRFADGTVGAFTRRAVSRSSGCPTSYQPGNGHESAGSLSAFFSGAKTRPSDRADRRASRSRRPSAARPAPLSCPPRRRAPRPSPTSRPAARPRNVQLRELRSGQLQRKPLHPRRRLMRGVVYAGRRGNTIDPCCRLQRRCRPRDRHRLGQPRRRRTAPAGATTAAAAAASARDPYVRRLLAGDRTPRALDELHGARHRRFRGATAPRPAWSRSAPAAANSAPVAARSRALAPRRPARSRSRPPRPRRTRPTVTASYGGDVAHAGSSGGTTLAPVAGVTANLTVLQGTVLISVPSHTARAASASGPTWSSYVALKGTNTIPMGATVDARDGTFRSPPPRTTAARWTASTGYNRGRSATPSSRSSS